MYRTDRCTPVDNGRLLSPHAIDLSWVLQDTPYSTSFDGGGPAVEKLADHMSDAWVAFARSGNPNTPSLPEWPPYRPETDRVCRRDPRGDCQTHFNSYSMSKSINSILVGLGLQDRYIRSVDDPVVKYLPELRGSGYDGTSLKDLLEMRSGVAWDDNFFAPDTTSDAAHVASWVPTARFRWDAARGFMLRLT